MLTIVQLTKKYQNLKEDDYNLISDLSWPGFNEFSQHQNVPDVVYQDIDKMLDLTEFNDPAFCILPFVGIEYPSNHYCCLVKQTNQKSTYVLQRDLVRTQMLNSVRPASCSACWQLEDHGIKSDRLLKNSTYDHDTESIKDLYKRLQTDVNQPITYYKIDTSAVCNSTCVTCGPAASSAWVKLVKKNSDIKVNTKKINSAEFNIDYGIAKHISFRGGEPFLSKKNFDILEELIKHNNTDCTISFTTNGSIWPTKKQLSILQRFSNLIIGLSIDGIGPVFEYLRYPLKWEVILSNIKKWKKLNVKLGVSYTVSNLNIYYYNSTVQWFKENNIPYLTNLVYSPEFYSIKSLPEGFKNKLYETLVDDFSEMLMNHTSTDDRNYKDFWTDIKRQDHWKNISINDFLPELVNELSYYQ